MAKTRIYRKKASTVTKELSAPKVTKELSAPKPPSKLSFKKAENLNPFQRSAVRCFIHYDPLNQQHGKKVEAR